MPSLRQLEYLTTLADTLHFGAAAAAVNVTQPTLSQQLKELEARLGVVLVERGKPIRLTPAGREIADRARRVLAEVGEIRKAADRSRSGIAGTIRLGVSPTLGPYLMPTAIVRLHRDHPSLRLYIREGIPDEQLAELRRGEIDMMLAPLPFPASGLDVLPLFSEPLHLVGAPDHPALARHPQHAADIAGAPVLSIDRRHHLHRQTEAVCAELGAELLRDYEGTSLDSVRQMAGSGLGLALLPELYLRSEAPEEQMVKRFTMADWQAERTIAACWRTGAAYAEAYRAISAVIATEAREILA